MRPPHLCSLVPHAAFPAPPGVSVSVCLEAGDDGSWRLSYRFADPQRQIRWPAPVTAMAADGLWQHTCCEAFVGVPGGDAYVEFNMSPSGQWACYRFAAYRARADQGQPTWRPRIECVHDGEETRIAVTITRALLPSRADRVGLNCVVEATDGTLSYWALVHPDARPDFHHRDGFALMLGKE